MKERIKALLRKPIGRLYHWVHGLEDVYELKVCPVEVATLPPDPWCLRPSEGRRVRITLQTQEVAAQEVAETVRRLSCVIPRIRLLVGEGLSFPSATVSREGMARTLQ